MSTEEVAKRLKQLRYAWGYADNQAGFAALMGMSSQQWNNYEKAKRRPDLAEAAKIRAVTGVTLDWIYLGSVDGLPVKLAAALANAATTSQELGA